MLTDQYKDRVCFSSLFCRDWNSLYKELSEILFANHVGYGTITYTKDYWCRDFMPIQRGCEMYTQFEYNPDYLKDKKKYRTDVDKILLRRMKYFRMDIKKFPLIIDGGNMVFCIGGSDHWGESIHYVVMTDKVMSENPNYTKKKIESMIRESLNIVEDLQFTINIVWLPWKHSDMYGHADGILHYVGKSKTGKPIVLVNLSLYEEVHANEMRSILKKKFEVIDLNLSKYDELSWAYINMLQTRDVIIIPGIGNPVTDKEAYEQIKSLHPEYGDKVYQVQMRDFIKEGGGALNCCTWTFSKEMSHIPHNEKLDAKWKELAERAKRNENIEIEDIFFMGDYYPHKLEDISRNLDDIYWGF